VSRPFAFTATVLFGRVHFEAAEELFPPQRLPALAASSFSEQLLYPL
jgi:hypothetical protein